MKNPMPSLYDRTPSEAVAALMVDAACRGSADDIRMLFAGVAGDRVRHGRYRERRESLMLVVMMWANDCLRTRATMVTLSAIIASGEAVGNEILNLDVLHGAYKAKLAALYAAMAKFADETGLDMATIKELAEADVTSPQELPAPSVTAVDDLLSMYRGLL